MLLASLASPRTRSRRQAQSAMSLSWTAHRAIPVSRSPSTTLSRYGSNGREVLAPNLLMNLWQKTSAALSGLGTTRSARALPIPPLHPAPEVHQRAGRIRQFLASGRGPAMLDRMPCRSTDKRTDGILHLAERLAGGQVIGDEPILRYLRTSGPCLWGRRWRGRPHGARPSTGSVILAGRHVHQPPAARCALLRRSTAVVSHFPMRPSG